MKKLLALLIVCVLLLSCSIGGDKMPVVREGYTYEKPDINKWGGVGTQPYGPFPWELLPNQTTPYSTPTNYPTVTPYGETGYGYTPPITAEQTAWQRWQPYLQGLGIIPQSSGYLTSTSPAMRSRMNPLALLGMQDYFGGGQKSWADYLNWAGGFMPQTPNLQQRRWSPWMWR